MASHWVVMFRKFKTLMMIPFIGILGFHLWDAIVHGDGFPDEVVRWMFIVGAAAAIILIIGVGMGWLKPPSSNL